MAKTKIVGWTRKTGTFESSGKNIAYDNVIFYLTVEGLKDERIHGTQTSELKIKANQAIVFNGGTDDFNPLIGREVRLDYELVNGKPLLVDLQIVK